MLKKPQSKRMISKRPRHLNTEAPLARSTSEARKLPHRQGIHSNTLPVGQFPVGEES